MRLRAAHLLDGLDGPGDDDAPGLHALAGGLGVVGGGGGGQHAGAHLAGVTQRAGGGAGAGGAHLGDATLHQEEEFVLHLRSAHGRISATAGSEGMDMDG